MAVATRAFVLLCTFLAFVSAARCGSGRWVDVWGSMPQLVEPANLPNAPWNQTGVVFRNATLRQTIRISLGAHVIRLQISNAFGGSDLPITAVTVGVTPNNTAGIAGIQGDLHKVTFSGGQAGFTVPVGALVVSDPIELPLKALDVLSVSIYLERGQTTNSITGHPGSRTTSWFAPGNAVEAKDFTGQGIDNTDHWYFISRVEGWAPTSGGSPGALVIVGDSITDGRGSTHNQNNRWADVLMNRLAASSTLISVINQAAGGNRILNDGLGPSALSRIDRDVLATSALRYAVIFEGVNDIGTAAATTAAQQTVRGRIIAAYEQMIARCHAKGVAVFGATITPMSGPGQAYGEPAREVTRLAVNEWIRTSGRFDAVVDFDALVRDPGNQTRLLPAYDTGDYLHLNPAGYQAMGESFDLSLLEKFKDGVWSML
ncbi:lipolytic enzyme [Pyricularia oryzae 70-15]|uniref:Lipolytic enzyme n=3 Tax=Pyricularia oryzae TaxID=318829 RepID=G4MQR7_PYRO7|nr:lipolytic enzyme [Pyricularia oryzae 70-15]EHA57354.1 lipolytic enzyme [Pyricularia oryzae 70-15]ELQ40622.1 lipolytic enzyme [Pyricularia oryzae Y34]KAI7923171.1 lipolytic enzyme [Pyricularia oryzae]KAI7924123.1 lipolytic enzyme [Pyricularia oryzae]